MTVALLFQWGDLHGVYRSPELARRAALVLAGGKLPLKWTKLEKGVQSCFTAKGVELFEVCEEEVIEA